MHLQILLLQLVELTLSGESGVDLNYNGTSVLKINR